LPEQELKDRLGGVFLPVTTPFDHVTGDIAPVALRENLRRYVEAGVDGLLLFGSTGEGALLDADEMQRLTAFAREVVPAGIPLLVGSSAESTRATIRLTNALAQSGADAVVLTPAHQHPTGVVLSPGRRAELVAWLRGTGAIVIEDDYDAEYRYDRAAVGALQGLEPDRVFYAGSTSKTLAPALRLGWLVVPAHFLDTLRHDKLLADQGTARIEQHAFANFLERGELDRHLRRMRASYRARRDALVHALEEELPDGTVRGVAAGLHVTVELPGGYDEQAIKAEAQRRRLAFSTTSNYSAGGPLTLMLGYGQVPEAAIRAGVREIAAAVGQSLLAPGGVHRETPARRNNGGAPP
jgi:aspartate/methionine/tyrosine aminotransferase